VGSLAAVDLGATSGRVILGHVGQAQLNLHQVARFPNTPVRTPDGLHWNMLELYRNVVEGLSAAVREDPDVVGAGVDSWAVDYALLRRGAMIANPFHYREERTEGAISMINAEHGAAELFGRNGLQFLPFNTLYQLTSDDPALLAVADRMLLIPDLISFWLTGRQVAERTNASTTGLLNVHSGRWDDQLITQLGLSRDLFADLIDPGETIGELLPEVVGQIRSNPGFTVKAVGSHDTASAVVAIPATTDDFAFISCGTWGLVGVELERPVLTDEARLANFTNEGGVDSRIRFLHNVMGLWLLSESVRTWERDGQRIDLESLLQQADQTREPVTIFDPNDERFLPPGDMPARIADYCHEHGLPVPGTRAAMTRSILASLANAFAESVEQAARLSGKKVQVIHLVGGGAQNRLLCQLIAAASGLPVEAGPVEATAMGNLLVQARAHGFLPDGDLESLRSIVVRNHPPTSYPVREVASSR
jgi:rhamnulokinase